MLGNSIVNNRIFWGISLPIIFASTLSITLYVKSQNSLKFEQETQLTTNTLLEVNDFMLEMGRLARNARSYVLLPDRKYHGQIYQETANSFTARISKIKSLQLAINKVKEENKKQFLLINLIQQAETLFNDCEAARKLLEENKVVEAREIIENLNLTAIENIQKQLMAEITNNYAINQGKFAGANELMLGILVLATALSIAISIILSLLINLVRKNQREKLLALPESISERNFIRSGEKSLHNRTDISDRDESRQLLDNFEVMTDRLSSLIVQMQTSAMQITSYSREIVTARNQLESPGMEDLQSNYQVVQIAEKIAFNCEQVSQTIDEVTEIYQDMANTVTNGKENLASVEENMHQLAHYTNSISSRMGTITEQSHNISRVVTTISQVADRANLLSLNAAIETEKAGAYGAGFAAIVREIRQLADQTALATLDIEIMVKDMQNVVSNEVTEIEKFSQELSQSLKEVHNVSQQLAAIISQIQHLTPRFQVVSQGMANQTQAASQINQAISSSYLGVK
jgi:methyl-accepting chemotaxis protein WspA